MICKKKKRVKEILRFRPYGLDHKNTVFHEMKCLKGLLIMYIRFSFILRKKIN